MLKMHSGAAALAAALFVCAAGTALGAAQFSLSPLLLRLPADKLATSLALGNAGAEAVTVQAELVAWSQESGDDAYGPAPGMVVSPPIFTVAAGAQQVVRVGRTKRIPAPEREVAYRIKLSEVPPKAGERPQVMTVMNVSLPVFVPPADKGAKPALGVQATALPNGDAKLAFANTGRVHDKVVKLVLTHDGKVVAERSINYYVLAGAKRELAWPGVLKDAPKGPLELRVHLEGRDRILRQAIGN